MPMNTVCPRRQFRLVTPWSATTPAPIVAIAWIFFNVDSFTRSMLDGPIIGLVPARSRRGRARE